MWNVMQSLTKDLAKLGLTNTTAVSQALGNAVMSNPNRDPIVIMKQKAALMVAEFYNGSTEYVKGESK